MELSLFTGAGGGLLGTKLLGFKHIGYVEYDEYCQRVIAQRIKDGYLDEGPIFGDIRTFISEGYADAYKGLVDVITAGFPCQPFSVCGQRKGGDDDRNMWPETIDCIRIIRPQYVLLENVPGLLTHPYARQIYSDLAESDDAVNRKKGKFNSRGEPKLSAQVKMITTPRACEGSKANQIQRDGKSLTLTGFVKRYQTPRTGHGMTLRLRQKQRIIDVSRLEDRIALEETTTGGYLNPTWVEWLMGWPIGWTELKPLAMDKYQQWLRQFGSY